MTDTLSKIDTPTIKVLYIAGSNFGRSGLSTAAFNWAMDMPSNVIIDFYSVKHFEPSSYVDRILERGGTCYSAESETGGWRAFVCSYSKLRNLLHSVAYDVVHIHADNPYKALAHAICAKFSGVRKIIIHSHSAGVDNPSTAKRLINSISKLLLPAFSTGYLTCSDKATKWMFPKRIIDDVKTVGNYPDVRKFRFDADTRSIVRRKMRIDANMTVVGFIGRLVYQKNPVKLVEIYSEVVRRVPDSCLIIIGSGELESEVKACVSDKGLNQRTIFINHTDHPEHFMQAFDVLLLPSRFEGNPLVIGEASASGLPCCVSVAVSKDCALANEVYFLETSNTEKWIEIIKRIDVGIEARKARSQRYLRAVSLAPDPIKQILSVY